MKTPCSPLTNEFPQLIIVSGFSFGIIVNLLPIEVIFLNKFDVSFSIVSK